MRTSPWANYLRFYRGRLRRLVLSVLVSAGQSLLVLPIAFIVRYAFERAIPRGDTRSLLLAGAVILGLIVVNNVVSLWPRYLSLHTTKLAIQDLRHELLARCYLFSRSLYRSADIGRLHSVIVQDVQRLDSMSNALVALFLPALINVLGLAAVLIYLNPVLFLALALAVPPLYLANRLFLKRRLARRIRASHRALERFSQGMMFVLRMMDLTRLQTAEEFELRRHGQNVEDVRRTGEANSMCYAAYTSVHNAISASAGVLILVVGGLAVISGRMTVAALLSFYVALALMIGYLQTLLSSVPYIVEGFESLKTLDRTFGIEDSPPYSGRRSIPFQGGVRLEAVDFGYSREPVLEAVDLDIPAGALVGLTGPNGAGKTTIAHLILGFYRPTRGRLTADGVPYEELDLSRLRRSIGVVSQDPAMFSGTILENLTYGRPEAGREEVERAAALAAAHEFIRALPRDYETPTGEDGLLLSGGQRQRLAIARALLRRPRLLILDEPTNHLDPAAVREVLRNIGSLEDSPSILLISHSPDVLREARRLYFLGDDGRLVPTEDSGGRR
jgi:ATP-binding cassette subfamily B protein